MRTRAAEVARDGVLVYLDQPAGGACAAAFAQMLQEGEGFVLREPGVFQGGALAFRERLLAGAAVDHADTLALAGPATEIKGPVAAVAPGGGRHTLRAAVCGA